MFTLAIIQSKSYGEGLILKWIFFNKNQKPGQLLCTVRCINVGQVITTCLQLHTGVPPQTRIVPVVACFHCCVVYCMSKQVNIIILCWRVYIGEYTVEVVR